MISDYQDLLIVVDACLSKMGFALVEDMDYWARFEDGSGWNVVFEGERYVRPAFDLTVEFRGEDKFELEKEAKARSTQYSIRILMEVFEEYEEMPHVVPSLTNQLEFLWMNKEKIFVYPPPYAEAYDQKNAWTIT